MILAIIGNGYWGSKIAETAKRLKYVTVKTYDINDYWEFEKFDSAVVATPAETHYEITKKLLLQGKHVLVEKPVAGSLDQVLELLDIANKRNVILQSGHILLFTKTTEYIKNNFSLDNLGLLETRRLNFGSIPKHEIPLHQHLLIHDLALVD